ncbi:glycerophosphodiester phosphodiesterase [Brevibacillus migulae]|uniref:glycerophosphodiester phosphodiesterase n=1 Tax=Brevibacillus migulae TaxID=1644114 RepID=UPI00106E37A4|nr:glycerophosphodiester phosphodiesterase [Brevibacillus migulae]
MKPLVYAHRGASGRFPENTLEAFRAAIRQKADGVELDVQFSKDRELVVIHDHMLNRTTDGIGIVQQFTFAELQQLSAGAWFDPQYEQSRIPRLEDVCALLAPTSLRLIIELKNFFIPQPGLEEKVIATLQQYALSNRTTISSFNFDSLLTIKQIDPQQKTALLYIGALQKPWEIAARYQAQELHAPKEVITPSLVKQAHLHRVPIIAWTVNSEKRLRQLFTWKIDGVITNYPFRARKMRNVRR